MTNQHMLITVADAQDMLHRLLTALDAVINGNDFPERASFLKEHIGLQMIYRIRAAKDGTQLLSSFSEAQRPLLVNDLNQHLIGTAMADARLIGFCNVLADARRWKKKRPSSNFEFFKDDTQQACDRISLALRAYESSRLPNDPDIVRMTTIVAEESADSYKTHKKKMLKLTGFGQYRDGLLRDVAQKTLQAAGNAIDLLSFEVALKITLLEINPALRNKKEFKEMFKDKDAVINTLEKMIRNARDIESNLNERRTNFYKLAPNTTAAFTLN